MFVFWEICRALISWNPRFEIRSFALTKRVVIMIAWEFIVSFRNLICGRLQHLPHPLESIWDNVIMESSEQ